MQIKFLPIAILFSLSITATPIKTKVKNTSSEITFDSIAHNFGIVIIGTQCHYSFRFKNTGNAPLIIENSNTSCGCDLTEWSHEPVLPGKTGVIHYRISTSGRQGSFTKSITVSTNAKNVSTTILTVCGMVYDPLTQPIPSEWRNKTCGCLKKSTNIPSNETNQAVKDSVLKMLNSKPETKSYILSNTTNSNKKILNIPVFEILIYPNPSKGQFNINSEHAFIESIDVINANGQIIKKFKSFGNEEIKFIDLSDQLDGYYFLTLTTSSGVYRKKLVLIRYLN